MRAIAAIQENTLQSIRDLNTLAGSLQKEFEYFARAEDMSEKNLQAKQRQIKSVESIKETMRTVQTLSEALGDHIFKLECCAVYFGVSFEEILIFLNRDQAAIDKDIRGFLKTGMVQVPDKFQRLIDFENLERLENEIAKAEFEGKKPPPKELPPPPRFSTRPLVGIDNILKMIGRSKAA